MRHVLFLVALTLLTSGCRAGEAPELERVAQSRSWMLLRRPTLDEAVNHIMVNRPQAVIIQVATSTDMALELVRPHLTDSPGLTIHGGRHPVEALRLASQVGAGLSPHLTPAGP